MTARVDPFELRIDPPLETARETLHTRRGLLFRVESSPGGIGESAPLEPFTESLEASRTALDRAVEGFAETGWRGALRIVSETAAGRLRWPAARHAVSQALLDWRARHAGRSVAGLLGGSQSSVPVNATVGDGDPAETAARVERAQAAGFPAVKVKVGRGSVGRDLDRLRRVRERVGGSVELRADANGAWDLEAASRFLEGAAGLDLAYVEQPLPVDRTWAHAELDAGPPIALDESLSEHSVQALLAADLGAHYVLKPMALGGIDLGWGAAHRIRRAGARATVTSIVESVVGRTGAVHLAGALADPPAAGLSTADLIETDLGPDPAPVADGQIRVPSGPGLGVEVITRG
ncbi:MAG: mandelate racemase/muconate lactonizing enzyme family protein [Halodesulfurarchaeum sp.]